MAFPSTILRPAIRELQPIVASAAGVLGRGRIFLPLIGGLYIFGIITYALVWVVDPYALRSRANIKLGEFAYADDIIPRLYSVAARDGTDLVVLGGSTSTGFTTAMLRAAFPEAKKPVNLSYAGQSLNGLSIALARITASSTLKRIILTLDWNLITDRVERGGVAVKRFYATSWDDPVPEFDVDSILLVARLLIGGRSHLPDRRRRHPDRPDFMKTSLPMTASPQTMARMAAAADASRAWITRMPPLDCDAIPSLRALVLPLAQRMAARGVAVDLFMPPYSLALYADWSVNIPNGMIFPRSDATFANLLSLRRCAVELASRTPNLRVHAFDTDVSITRDLSHYYDVGHLNDPEVHRKILARMAKGEAVLTPAGWPAYQAALEKAVQEFRP
jgi:hypothetical protein